MPPKIIPAMTQLVQSKMEQPELRSTREKSKMDKRQNFFVAIDLLF